MLSQFPFSRLALLRHVPFWAQAASVCALFAIAGVAALDDYGMNWDETDQRRIARANADYILGVSEYAVGVEQDPPLPHNRYYGVVFEMPLLLAERSLGLQDTRRIYLMRHLVSHLFFIAGGFACAMLAYRMLGNRWVALLAMLMFLLHPRLYAQSFFNSKDVPFAVMLVISLYLAHRAFRKDTIGAFLLCGIVAGLAINLRVFGLMLLPMILAMRALDMWQAAREERKRILASAGIFAAAAIAVVYIIHPYYWDNPLRFIEGVRVMSQHPTITPNLFMGEIYPSDAVPWNYIPVWFAITAPPLTLPLGAIGCAAVCWQGIARPLAALRDRETRFRILLLGCFVTPVVVAIALQSNIYQGWRQMYFLWTPFCLLAAFGLGALAKGGASDWAREGVAARLPGWIRGGAARQALTYGVAGVGLITTLTAMAALHPHQQVYFNALVDTKTPDALGGRYDMDYGFVAHRQLLERLTTHYPDGALRVWPERYNPQILPQNDRERIVFTGARDADFHLNPRLYYRRGLPDPPTFHSIRAYGSVMAFILAPTSDAYRDYYHAEYDDVEANGMLLAREYFEVYIHNGVLYYLNADCAPPTKNPNIRIFLHFFPVDRADLPADRRERGFENADFRFNKHAAFFDGKCIHKQPLPDYPIARIRTSQDVEGKALWRADIDLATHAAAQELYDGIVAGDYGRPAAQSDFDVYLRGDRLAYLKESCVASDTDARFFLHIIPADPADLSADRRNAGFENLDFQFADYGADIVGKCVAERDLPDYAIERVRTGQFVSGEGHLWSAEFTAGQ